MAAVMDFFPAAETDFWMAAATDSLRAAVTVPGSLPRRGFGRRADCQHRPGRLADNRTSHRRWVGCSAAEQEQVWIPVSAPVWIPPWAAISVKVMVLDAILLLEAHGGPVRSSFLQRVFLRQAFPLSVFLLPALLLADLI